MIIDNFIEFIKITNPKEVIGLDVSKTRIGVALSNKQLKIALPLTTIIRKKFAADIKTIIQIYGNYNCGGIVLGYPINLNSDKGKRCQSIRAFARYLLEHLNTPIFLENEEYSTYAIKDFFKENNIKNKKPIDHLAATYFLQNFLNRL